jgi:hypothetical protein
MTVHIGLDPGKRKMGLAVIGDGIAAGVAVRVESPWSETQAVNAVLDGMHKLRLYGFDLHYAHVHVENPQHYGGSGAAFKKDVEALQALAGRLERELRPLGYHVTLYRPNKWKGSVPKPVHHRRIRRALSAAELRLIEAQDYGDAQADVWDAVGLALFGAKRLGRGGKRT